MAHPLPPGGAVWVLFAEPALAVGLVAAAGLYAAGWRRLRFRGRGRAALPPWRARCYAGGLAALGTATLTPIAAYGDLLFSVHMAQHLLLILVAAPLLWLGAPLLPTLWGLPRGLRRAVGRLMVAGHPVRRLCRVLARPAVAMPLHVATVSLWHIPALYDAAQGPTLVHDLEHLLFLGTALLYWWPVVYPAPGRRPLGQGLALLYLVPPMLASDLIGAILSLAQTPLYATYAAAPRVSDLSVVADQQLGGLIMWVGGGLLWLAAMGLVLFLAPEDDARSLGPAAARPAPLR